MYLHLAVIKHGNEHSLLVKTLHLRNMWMLHFKIRLLEGGESSLLFGTVTLLSKSSQINWLTTPQTREIIWNNQLFSGMIQVSSSLLFYHFLGNLENLSNDPSSPQVLIIFYHFGKTMEELTPCSSMFWDDCPASDPRAYRGPFLLARSVTAKNEQPWQA